MALAISAVLDPERQAAKLTVTGVTAAADTVTIERTSPSGNTAGVRGAVNAPVPGSSFIVRDFEIPFNLTVTYTARTYDGGVLVATATTTFQVTWVECEAYLVDIARPSNSLPLVIENLDELAFLIPTGVHRVLDRRAPVLTSLPAYTPNMELNVLTDNLDERDGMRALLGSGYPILVRTTPEQGIGNIYLGLTDFSEIRFLTLGTQPERRFRLSALQVERPDPSLFTPQPPNTYANVKTNYASYAVLLATVGTYDNLAYTWPDEPTFSPVVPWLPDDV